MFLVNLFRASVSLWLKLFRKAQEEVENAKAKKVQHTRYAFLLGSRD
jgi:hypothetical protein